MGYVSSMNDPTKTACIKRLSRIEGQVRGLSPWSRRTATASTSSRRLSAVRAALRRVEQEVLRDHVGHCVKHAMQSDDKHDQQQKINEIIDVLVALNADQPTS